MMLVYTPLWCVAVGFPTQEIGAPGHKGSVLSPASKLQYLCLFGLALSHPVEVQELWSERRKKWLEVIDRPLQYF